MVNVEAAVYHEGRYLMILRGEEESHAPGILSFPGGKVENARVSPDILEETAHREVREETGVEIASRLDYVESSAFVTDDGIAVVDVVFLCRYLSGTPVALEPGEVAAVAWLSPDEILSHPKTPPFIKSTLLNVEARREKG